MADSTVSIIGLGWLGLPLAKKLMKAGFAVKGSTTTPDKADAFAQLGIETYQLLLDPNPTDNLVDLLRADTLVINIPPKAGKFGEAFHPKQISALVNAIRHSPVKHIIYVSSTSVYPELNRMVVESDVTQPAESPAPALVEAEHIVQQLASERTVTILRCGGLMGYDRIPGKYIAGKTVDSGDVPVNYIHRDDAVAILQQLIQERIPGTFNAVAPEHPVRKAIYLKSCADFRYESPVFRQPDLPIPYKVVSVDKLIQATAYSFEFPDPLQFYYQL